MKDAFYPVTIFKTRYGGIYEGAKWVALNIDEDDLNLFEEIRGDDFSCMEFFARLHKGEIVKSDGEELRCGLGDSPNEALENL